MDSTLRPASLLEIRNSHYQGIKDRNMTYKCQPYLECSPQSGTDHFINSAYSFLE
jgi:hypothetical protein